MTTSTFSHYGSHDASHDAPHSVLSFFVDWFRATPIYTVYRAIHG